MKKVLILTAILFANFTFSQQELQFTQQYDNPFFFNPALGGLNTVIQLNGGYRNQWTNISNSPSSFYFSGSSIVKSGTRETATDEFNTDRESVFTSPFNSVEETKHVLGGKFIGDRVGPFNKTSFFANYSYHMPFTKNTMLSLGVSAGWSNLSLDQGKVVLLDEDDSQYNQFLTSGANQNMFDLQAGIGFYGKGFHFGISANQLLKNDVILNQIITGNSLERHYFFIGAYEINASESIVIEPNILAQVTSNSPLTVSVGARVIYERKFYGGLMYRSSDAIAIMGGLNFGRMFQLGYSYDIAIGKIRNAKGGSHEIQLGILIGNNRNIKKEIDNGEK